ncbi:Longin-like domain superfamily [Arabidopsis thaliana x Arabidopsis arenosa]|nr:Longin-like domain superfamily [Arabidopsis thaliana x Arabidopsis arenosa]
MEKSETNLNFFCPNINPLKAYSWQVQCPPKIRHFIWQILTECVPVTENLWKRGIDCDRGCATSGTSEETINHTLFQCHPARQIWALSQIPTAMGIFSTESNFTNLDHLFWRIPTEFDSSAFPWIIWYIWKARNEKIFENKDTDPAEVLRLAEKEAQLWQSAQIELHNENPGSVDLVNQDRVRDISLEAEYSGYRCFVDGSWKESDKFSGTGWFCTSSNGEPPTMGAANLRRSLSPLHAKVEALLWAMKCMIGADNQEVAFFTDCSDLVKMVSSPTEWPAFSVYLEEFQSDKKEFSSFSLSLISRRANVKADNLARNVHSKFLRQSKIILSNLSTVIKVYLGSTTMAGTNDSCPLVKNILLLDSEGKRVAVKYYSDDWTTNAAKLAFEKYVFSKTSKTNARTEAEITLLENNIVVYKFAQDLHFFVTGGENENELVLSSVLQGFFDAVALLLRNNVEKMEALENLDLIFLCLDEMVDQGMVLETDANVIAGKVAMQSAEASGSLSEQTLTQALATAREHLARSLLT